MLVTAEVDWSDIRLGYVWFEFRPRVNLTRFHGVFAPNSRLRSKVTPGGSARRCRSDMVETESERRAAKTRAQRLKRVFRIDMETCRHCGGRVKIIASIEAPGSSDRSSTVWVHVPVNSH